MTPVVSALGTTEEECTVNYFVVVTPKHFVSYSDSRRREVGMSTRILTGQP